MQTANRPTPVHATTPHAASPTTADPKYCRHCFPSFEIPTIDALNARRRGIWVPFVDPVYGNRMQVHAKKEEVMVCGEREAGVALVKAVKEALAGNDGLLLGP